MSKYRIIGNMTGNSMDALDFVLTEFDGDKMTDVCTFSKPFDAIMQQKIEQLRRLVYNKTALEIEVMPEFVKVHDEYIRQVADAIDEMCQECKIDKSTIDAIGFHGKTLDHNPPSKAHTNGDIPYTLQMGSGEMLADLTKIKVVYDFRSPLIMNGFEGAPLIPPHNAHIALSEGDGIYYNGGNTSNFALIHNKVAIIGSDSGPFNEYSDSWVRLHTEYPFDENGKLGSDGKIDKNLIRFMFEQGESFYNSPLPKSGDPAYYHKQEIFDYADDMSLSFVDSLRTFEYFAAYIAAYTLAIIPTSIALPDNIVLFGGGWHNPLVLDDFTKLLKNEGIILPQHKELFAELKNRFSKTPKVSYSSFGKYMEARLFADMARYRLEEKPWELAEVLSSGKPLVLGRIAEPSDGRDKYIDRVNLAAKGWQYR